MQWPTKDERRWMLRGASFVAALVLIVGLGLGGWIIWIRALHGQQAYEYLDALQKQQQSAAKSAPTK